MTQAKQELSLLTTEEVAQLLRVHPFTVRRWIAEGLLPARRVGRRKWLIDRDDVLDFVSKNTNARTTTTDVIARELVRLTEGLPELRQALLAIADALETEPAALDDLVTVIRAKEDNKQLRVDELRTEAGRRLYEVLMR